MILSHEVRFQPISFANEIRECLLFQENVEMPHTHAGQRFSRISLFDNVGVTAFSFAPRVLERDGRITVGIYIDIHIVNK